jgi:hypothetical protein
MFDGHLCVTDFVFVSSVMVLKIQISISVTRIAFEDAVRASREVVTLCPRMLRYVSVKPYSETNLCF